MAQAQDQHIPNSSPSHAKCPDSDPTRVKDSPGTSPTRNQLYGTE